MKLFVAGKAIITDSNGKILLLRESNKYEEGTNVGRWDVPGGRLESDETIEQGLLREVKEEIGLEIKSGRLLDALENFPVIHNEKVHIIRLYYQCSTDSFEVNLSKDHDEFKWIDISDIHTIDVMDDVKAVFKKLES